AASARSGRGLRRNSGSRPGALTTPAAEIGVLAIRQATLMLGIGFAGVVTLPVPLLSLVVRPACRPSPIPNLAVLVPQEPAVFLGGAAWVLSQPCGAPNLLVLAQAGIVLFVGDRLERPAQLGDGAGDQQAQ